MSRTVETVNGWVLVFPGRGEPTGDVAKFLSHGPTDCMRKRPHLRGRFVVPITRDGDTAELHSWYDQVIFPDTSPLAHPESGRGEN